MEVNALRSPSELKPDHPEYQRMVRGEIRHYSRIFLGERATVSAQTTLVEPMPPSWADIENRANAIVRDATGSDWFGHVVSRLAQPDGVKLLSLGSGPGGIELSLARAAPQSEISCIDINPDLIGLGAERARTEELNVHFQTGDLNVVDLPEGEFDLVLCHASLHHVINLEHLANQIRKTLRPQGRLIVVDICAQNGYLMWPETKQVIQKIFATLPARFRINNTSYGKPMVDELIWEMDTSLDHMECVRAEDIIPVLGRTLTVLHFVPYFTICRRFLDTMYGPNYDLNQSLDRAVLNWIWELDLHYLRSNLLKPDTFFAIYAR